MSVCTGEVGVVTYLRIVAEAVAVLCQVIRAVRLFPAFIEVRSSQASTARKPLLRCQQIAIRLIEVRTQVTLNGVKT